VLGGLAYLTLAGAPPLYAAVNSGALAIAACWIALGREPASLPVRRALCLVLLAVLFLPLLTGPELNHVARWLPLGPVTLHAGMLAVPALVVLGSQDDDYAMPILLGAVFAALLQPDAATGFALTFACAGLHHVTRDWRIGLACIAGFFASIAMHLHGEIAPQLFVERVLADLILHNPLGAAALFLSLLAGFLLMLHRAPQDRAGRFALAGSLFGFSTTAIMANYPSALIGYGASPILGYGLALGLRRRPDL